MIGSSRARRRRPRAATAAVALVVLCSATAAGCTGSTVDPAGADSVPPDVTAAHPGEVGAGSAGDQTGRGNEVADPGLPGPFHVGYRTVEVTDPDRPGRRLTTGVWYPTAVAPAPTDQFGDARRPQPARYDIVAGVSYESRLASADVPPAEGSFPLVVYSHGSAGDRTQAVFLTEAVASHGFVVAAPDHVGDTLDDFAAGQEASLVALASDRTLDLSAVVDAMTASASPLAGVVDEDRTGVVGFSFGGMSALASASGFLSAPADPRVDAVVAIAPASEPMPADLLATIDVPVLLFGGTMDGASPVARNAVPAFEQLRAAEPRYLVVVDRAAHNSFTDLCHQSYLAADEGVPVGARVRIEVGAASTCLPPTAPAAEVQLVTSTYTVAFLSAQLRGDAAASAVFDADRPPPSSRATLRSAP